MNAALGLLLWEEAQTKVRLGYSETNFRTAFWMRLPLEDQLLLMRMYEIDGGKLGQVASAYFSDHLYHYLCLKAGL